MSDNQKLTYYHSLCKIMFLLLAVTGFTSGAGCCDKETQSDSKVYCCCSEMVQDTPVCNSGFSVLQKINMPDNCPCAVSSPVHQREALPLSPGTDLKIAANVFEYDKSSKETDSSYIHTFSLHLQHSSKTYRFSEAYLI